MSPAGPDEGGAADPVGSVAEEAAKLFAALSARAGEHRGGGAGADSAGAADGRPDGANAAAPHGENCRWCPLCQAIGLVRGTSPEVRDQLVASAGAFVLAVRELLDQVGQAPAREAGQREAGQPGDSGVEHIDLGDESGDEPWA